MTEEKNPIGDMPIEVTFTVNQVNELLHTLAHLPFHQSAPIIKMIQDQAIPQAQKHEEAVKNVEKATEEV
jgi:hypothetical protein